MPAFAQKISYGSLVDNGTGQLVDEAGLFLTDLTMSASREKEEDTDSGGTVIGLAYFNPSLTLSYTGSIDVSTAIDESFNGVTEFPDYISSPTGVLTNNFGDPGAQDPSFAGSVDLSGTGVASHPGTYIKSLANFGALSQGIMGFDPTDGVMVLEESERTLSSTEKTEMTGTIVHYPFVANTL